MATDLLPMEATSVKAAPRKLYHFGLLKEAPVDHITVGGQAWSKTTYIPSREKGTQHQNRAGHVGRFTTDEIAGLKKKMTDRVVRWTKKRANQDGTVRRFGVVLDRTANYSPQPDDEPLGRYAYLAPVDHDPAQPIPELIIPGDVLAQFKPSEQKPAGKTGE